MHSCIRVSGNDAEILPKVLKGRGGYFSGAELEGTRTKMIEGFYRPLLCANIIHCQIYFFINILNVH